MGFAEPCKCGALYLRRLLSLAWARDCACYPEIFLLFSLRSKRLLRAGLKISRLGNTAAKAWRKTTPYFRLMFLVADLIVEIVLIGIRLTWLGSIILIFITFFWDRFFKQVIDHLLLDVEVLEPFLYQLFFSLLLNLSRLFWLLWLQTEFQKRIKLLCANLIDNITEGLSEIYELFFYFVLENHGILFEQLFCIGRR